MASKEVEANHHDNDHHSHEVLGRHYGWSKKKQKTDRGKSGLYQHFTLQNKIPQINCSLICFNHLLPVRGEPYIVIQVIYVLPAVDINSSRCCDDQHHEAQFNQVADLYQHGGGNEWHHSHEAVVLWILCAASVTEWLQHGAGGAVKDSKGERHAAQLQHQRWSAWVVFSEQMLCSLVFTAQTWLAAFHGVQIIAFNWNLKFN